MPAFHYKAVTPGGETVEGRMDAASVEDVIQRLQEQGNVPLEAGDATGGGSLFGGLRRKSLTGGALVEFTSQLGILLHAGLPLDRALQMLLELPEGERAFMQTKWQVDAVPPEVREQFKKMQRE